MTIESASVARNSPERDARKARGWRSLNGWLSLFVTRYVAQEHRCYPPVDGRHWRQITTPDTPATDAYECPECGQFWQSQGLTRQ